MTKKDCFNLATKIPPEMYYWERTADEDTKKTF